jgi:hypothetical protein
MHTQSQVLIKRVLFLRMTRFCLALYLPQGGGAVGVLWSQEDFKEQPISRNLSATASVHAQLQLLGNILRLFTPHLTSHLILTPNYVNNVILHLLSVLCTAVNARNKN